MRRFIPSILLLLSGLVALSFDSIFWGLSSIAVAIAFFAIANSWGQRKDRLAYGKTQTSLDTISKYFEQNAKAAIEEKIGVLNRLTAEISGWDATNADAHLDRAASDIRAVVYLKDFREGDQKERLNAAIRKLKKAIEDRHLESGRIDDVAKLLD